MISNKLTFINFTAMCYRIAFSFVKNRSVVMEEEFSQTFRLLKLPFVLVQEIHFQKEKRIVGDNFCVPSSELQLIFFKMKG